MLRLANQKPHSSTCSLFQKQLALFGRRIWNGITVHKETSAIRDWPTLHNSKELRSFLGARSFYRRISSSFADISSPLNEIQKNETSFVLTDKQEDEWNELKTRLTSSPKNEWKRSCHCYVSRCFSRAERIYHVSKKTFFLVVCALRTLLVNITLWAPITKVCRGPGAPLSRRRIKRMADVYSAIRFQNSTKITD